MNYSIRNIVAGMVTLVITTAGSVQGGYDGSPSYGYCEQPCAPEPCCSDSCGSFFLEADVLYLRAFEGGLFDACDQTETTDSTVNGLVVSRLEGKSNSSNFRWNWGFRVGAGYEFANSCSGVGVYWTHFNSHKHGDHNEKNNRQWKIDFDAVDILWGYRSHLSSCVVLTPYVGVKYANINQRLHTNFVSTATNITDPAVVHTRSRGFVKEEFWGVGPEIGIEGDFGIGGGLSLYGNIALSTLYGRFHVESDHIDRFSTGKNIDHLRQNIDAYQTVLDTRLGIRWTTCFCSDKIFAVQLGLEQHRYFDHNQICGNGDLNLDGVSLGILTEF